MTKNLRQRIPLIVVIVMLLVFVGLGPPDIGPLKTVEISWAEGIKIEFYPPSSTHGSSQGRRWDVSRTKTFEVPNAY